MPLFNAIDENASASQRAKFTEKVHKPPLGVNVIDFELNGFIVLGNLIQKGP